MDKAECKHRYGPVALVTGASSGIGRAFATLLAAQGINLLLVARRRDRLEDLGKALESEYGITTRLCIADLSQPESIELIMAACTGLDIGLLISNAGFGLKGQHQNNDPDIMTRMLNVNCHAPMQLCHRLIPRLLARGRGGIIITSSVEGLMGFPNSASYAASKAFTNSLGESLWGELSPHGIDVVALCPGSTDTEAHALQGIDPLRLEGMMSAEQVVQLALDNIDNGPIYIVGEKNQEMFNGITNMPRRDALLMVGENILNSLSLTARARTIPGIVTRPSGE